MNEESGLIAFHTILPGGRKGFDVCRVSGTYFPIVEPVAVIAGADERAALRLAHQVIQMRTSACSEEI